MLGPVRRILRPGMPSSFHYLFLRYHRRMLSFAQRNASPLYFPHYVAVAYRIHLHGKEYHGARALLVERHFPRYLYALKSLVIENVAYIQEYKKYAPGCQRIPTPGRLVPENFPGNHVAYSARETTAFPCIYRNVPYGYACLFGRTGRGAVCCACVGSFHKVRVFVPHEGGRCASAGWRRVRIRREQSLSGRQARQVLRFGRKSLFRCGPRSFRCA